MPKRTPVRCDTCLLLSECLEHIFTCILVFFFPFQMDFTLMEKLLKHINFYDTSFFIAVIAIIFNPLFWNVVRIAFLYSCYCVCAGCVDICVIVWVVVFKFHYFLTICVFCKWKKNFQHINWYQLCVCRNFSCALYPITLAIDRKICVKAPCLGNPLNHLSLHLSRPI